jgi:hypothetical protein
MKEETQSVRISKKVAKSLRVNAVNYGGTMRSLLEEGAYFAMGKNEAAFSRKSKIKPK